MIKKILKKIVPKRFILLYHKFLAVFANFIYGKPSEKIIVIGVTGTSGKSTVVNLIGRILEEAGFSVGWVSTLNFKIGKKEWINEMKMTMPGRFALQRILKKMVKSGCQYAIIETSSEGIIQYRHLGINYDILVFTNLSPEHIERHGGFENYKKAKGKLFKHLEKCSIKFLNGKEIKKITVINLDDENADYFLKFPAQIKYGYRINKTKIEDKQQKNVKIIYPDKINFTSEGSEFQIKNLKFQIKLLGKFNIYNSLAAISVALSQDIDLSICQKALEKIKGIPGRMQIIVNKPFKIIVDYAHTPDSLEKVYQTISVIPHSKLICVFGSAGGGRDKWKRPKLGEIASKYCQEVILTNEDPYDENPENIIQQIASGIKNNKFYKIVDRYKAIKKAIDLAQEEDIIIITGKGSEKCIMGPNGKRIPWDDAETVKKIIKEKRPKLDKI